MCIKLDDNKKLFFISDLHLFHKNIIKYQNRPFRDVQDMTEQLIHNWNSVVSDDDQIIFLGDFICGIHNAKEVSEHIYECLNGIKFFIRGNHDDEHKISKNLPWCHNDHDLHFVKYKEYDLILRHRPFEKKHLHRVDKSILIHGHTHHTQMVSYINNYKMINVSCEAINYKPISFEDVLQCQLSK